VNTYGLDIYEGAIKPSEGALLTIVGVAQPGFFGDTVGTSTDVWIPMMMEPAVMPGRPWLSKPNVDWVTIMGRTKAGITMEQASARMTLLWRQILTDEAGNNLTEDRKHLIAGSVTKLEPGENGFHGIHSYYSKPLQILFSVVGLVLLIVCLNVANLLLARGGVRRHEIGVRLALGASRGRLIRQLLTENLWLGALGGVFGLLIAFFGTRILVTLVSSGYEAISLPIQTDFRMLAFTAIVSLLVVVLFGLAPALRATKISVGSTLKEGSRTTVGARRTRLAKILVAAQIPISMVLLTGAGLFLRTLHNLRTQDVGYDAERLLVMRLDPVTGGYRGENIGRICKTILDRIAALPGVRAATFSENGLFYGPESTTLLGIEGFSPQSKWQDRVAHFDQVGPGYFTKIGIPLLSGRDITDRDNVGAPRVAVINETMAKFYFPGANPIGRHLRTGEGGFMQKFELEIVGVARDAQDHNFWSNPVRRFYVSYLQPIDGITDANFEIRTVGNPANVAAMLRKEVEAVDRNLMILGIREVQTLMNQSLVQERLIAKVSGFFGLLGAALAAIGLYGVIAHEVTQRTNEIGLRMALGAQRTDVLKWVLRQGIRLSLLGIVFGLAGTVAATHLIKSLLYKVEATDPATFVIVSLLLIGAALVACWMPAHRASRIDPMVALRYE
jgi:predicted permease